MTLIHFMQMILLAAVWGSAFLFIRISVPVLGPLLLTELRIVLAALFIFLICLFLKKRIEFGRYWRYFATLGIINSALPFMLFGYSAKTLPASVLAVLNATSPVWSTIILTIMTKRLPNRRTLLGLIVGLSGVGLLVGFDPMIHQEGMILSFLAALSGAACYAVAALYAKGNKYRVDPISNTLGSLFFASIVLFPLMLKLPSNVLMGITINILLATAALGLVCTGLAYLLYYRLIEQIGVTSALTVTFMIPVFGMLWGWLFLAEKIGWHMLFGALLILISVLTITGFNVKLLWKSHC